MHVDWPPFAAFLAAGDRARVVWEAWQDYADPYARVEAHEHERLQEMLGPRSRAETRRRRPDLAARAAAAAAWLTGRSATDGVVEDQQVHIGQLRLNLRPAVVSTIDNTRYTVLVHGGQVPMPGPVAAALVAAVERGAGGPDRQAGQRRSGAVLDLPSGHLFTAANTPPAEPPLAEARTFATLWHRFDLLASRLAIASHIPADTDIPGWDLAQVEWAGVRRILDVGCGTGRHLRQLAGSGRAVIGVEPSLGAVRHAVRDVRASGVVGNLDNLPIASGWADLVLAMHMLYNLPDMDAGLAEIRRVLRPGGQFVVATSARDTLSELHQLFDESVRALHPGPWRNRAAPHLHRFDLSNGGARLARVVRSVARRSHEIPVAIAGAEPVAAYVDSTRPWREPHLPPGLSWEATMAEVRRRANETVARDGCFRVTLREGLFVCR
ncbi:MAG: hypothetical protein V7603_1479 [Micromonosporaceae bacterium]